MTNTSRLFLHGSLVSLGLASVFAGCGSSTPPGGTARVDAGGDGGPQFVVTADGGGDASSSTPQCIVATHQCVNTTCAGGGTTNISGVVYDPAGNNPLYGIVAYVPSTTPSAITTGASCASCNSLYTGNPIAYAVTDPSGKFTITGVPDGANIPLVIQVGKWRMQYTIPSVTACTDNDASVLLNTKLKLPNDHTVGDLPAIAISTGAADTLECLLVRMGVDEAEYGGGASGTGRIHIFTTNNPDSGPGANTVNPAAPTSSTSLWAMNSQIMPYDIVLLTCEGAETDTAVPQTLFDYATGGGRVFASHFHYAWFTDTPATNPFTPENLATWTPTAEEYATANGVIDAVIDQTLPGGGTFPRGVAMAQWLGNVGALQPNGELEIDQARHNALVGATNTNSLPWITGDSNANPSGQTEYFSFDTPFGTAAAEQCGRVVYSDLHVGAASGDYGGYQTSGAGFGLIDQPAIVPTGCTQGALSAQEKALEFMLFDLSGCVSADQGAGGTVIPPPP